MAIHKATMTTHIITWVSPSGYKEAEAEVTNGKVTRMVYFRDRETLTTEDPDSHVAFLEAIRDTVKGMCADDSALSAKTA
jgi:hypothetical protein